VTGAFEKRADEVLVLGDRGIKASADAIEALGLDVMVFGDLGMDARFSMLAYRRYAPAQILFWGHPVTSALDEIDYVVAGEGFGAETIGDGFSEQVSRVEEDCLGDG
jgi:predicted O-linked N-acetylglucosamine transferase (SPINDLY family)